MQDTRLKSRDRTQVATASGDLAAPSTAGADRGTSRAPGPGICDAVQIGAMRRDGGATPVPKRSRRIQKSPRIPSSPVAGTRRAPPTWRSARRPARTPAGSPPPPRAAPAFPRGSSAASARASGAAWISSRNLRLIPAAMDCPVSRVQGARIRVQVAGRRRLREAPGCSSKLSSTREKLRRLREQAHQGRLAYLPCPTADGGFERALRRPLEQVLDFCTVSECPASIASGVDCSMRSGLYQL